jgi:Ca2+-binding RTX toxin-like protein
MRPTLTLLTLGASLLLPAGVASASTVSVEQPGGPAVFRSGPYASDLSVGSTLDWSDAAQPLIAGDGCDPGPPVNCGPVDQDIRFGAGNDRFRGFNGFAISVLGGGGGDVIRSAGLYNQVDAGSGADQVWENGNGPGYVLGGSGNDKLYSYGAETPVSGGTGDDLVITNAGGPSGVALTGGDGDDTLVARYGSGVAAGGRDDDVMSLVDATGAWTADGADCADVIAGGPDGDKVTAGSGNDVIDVSGDASRDSVDCGGGYDTVIYDAGDSISRNCEARSIGRRRELSQITRARADANAFIAAMPSPTVAF